MIQELNEKHTRIKVFNMFHTSNIIKFKRGEVFYFFKEMKTMELYNKKKGVRENIVRFEFQRTKQSNDRYAQERWGCSKHDFFNGEKFTDRFEFVNFNDIPEGVEKNHLVDAIKRNCFHYNFKDTNTFTKVIDDNIDHNMNAILETSNNGGRDYKAEELQKMRHEEAVKIDREMFGRNDIAEENDLDKLNRLMDETPITFKKENKTIKTPDNLYDTYFNDSQDIIPRKPETIILKKHTHKKDDKIVLTEPIELGFDMSPRGYGKSIWTDTDRMKGGIYGNSYFGGVDCATFNDTTVLVDKINEAANTISQHSTSAAADFMVTTQHVANQMTNIINIPYDYSGGNNIVNSADCVIGVASNGTNILLNSRYGNTEINSDLYDNITIKGVNDNTIILSKNKKEINNKVCISEDKLLIL